MDDIKRAIIDSITSEQAATISSLSDLQDHIDFGELLTDTIGVIYAPDDMDPARAALRDAYYAYVTNLERDLNAWLAAGGHRA